MRRWDFTAHRIKSATRPVDASSMVLTLAHMLSSVEGWLAGGVIAGWLVYMCLRTLAVELDFSVRRHRLMVEAKTLRMRQQQRLRELGVKVPR